MGIEQLSKMNNFKNGVLSIYLSVDSKNAPTDSQMKTVFHSLIHQNLTKEERKIFQEDIKRIEYYLLEQYDSHGKKSVVFFSSGDNLWEILEFEFALPTLCLVSKSPYLAPLHDALENHEKYSVSLLKNDQGSIYNGIKYPVK